MIAGQLLFVLQRPPQSLSVREEQIHEMRPGHADMTGFALLLHFDHVLLAIEAYTVSGDMRNGDG